MSILTAPVKPQNFTVDGIKFFKAHLDKIKLDTELTEHPITTSEISVFMILHLYIDDMGQIRSLTKDPAVSERKQLCISNLATDHDLTYETVKKAFDSLLKKNYIAEVHTENGMHYEIVDYAKYNQAINNPLAEEKSYYFRIPEALYQEKLFGTLIKHRYHRGPIMLLNLCSHFTAQVGTNRRNVENLDEIKSTLTMNHLKKTLNTTAARVRDFLHKIRNVFSFVPVDTVIKTPSLDRVGRKRTFSQVCIEKFTYTLNKSCFKRNENKDNAKTYANSKKEMAARIKNAGIPVKWRDLKDIEKSISRMVNYSTHFKVVGKAHDLMKFTVSSVADSLEKLHTDGLLETIKSIGAYVNKCFTTALQDYLKGYISTEERIDIGLAYQEIYGDYPQFLTKEQ